MAFDWLDFYRLANQLVVQTNDEAALRTSISRAYYAAYHLADDRRRQNNVALPLLPNAGLHVRLWLLFRNHTHSGCRKVGLEGDRLRKRRAAADYDPSVSDLPLKAALASQETRALLERIGSLPANLP